MNKRYCLALLALLSSLAFSQEIDSDESLIPPHYLIRSSPVKQLSSPINPNELVTIDLMVLYTPSLQNPEKTIHELVESSNQVYRNSLVNINLRVVHSEPVWYTDYGTNRNTLMGLTYGSEPSFFHIHTLRDQKKADLVVLIRPFNYYAQQSCGIAWIIGAGGRAMSVPSQSAYGYSVVSYGHDGSYSCSPYAFIHELGHNMGLAHDKANASSSGVFSYSYGYQVPGIFGTVMSYGHPRIGRFSSPEQYCTNGLLCGHAGANNVKSLNEIRQSVAEFRN